MRKEVGLQELGWTLDHLVIVLCSHLLPLVKEPFLSSVECASFTNLSLVPWQLISSDVVSRVGSPEYIMTKL